MNVLRGDFLLSLTLAATGAVTLAAGADVAQVVEPAGSNGAQRAASIPDFAGIWAQ